MLRNLDQLPGFPRQVINLPSPSIINFQSKLHGKPSRVSHTVISGRYKER